MNEPAGGWQNDGNGEGVSERGNIQYTGIVPQFSKCRCSQDQHGSTAERRWVKFWSNERPSRGPVCEGLCTVPGGTETSLVARHSSRCSAFIGPMP